MSEQPNRDQILFTHVLIPIIVIGLWLFGVVYVVLKLIHVL
jgi:hypothetical protein